MSGRILLNTGNSAGQMRMAVDVNRVVKQHRGKSLPFVTLVVEENGEVSLVSNMDVRSEQIQLLFETAVALRKGEA